MSHDALFYDQVGKEIGFKNTYTSKKGGGRIIFK